MQYGLPSILADAPGLDQITLAAELGIDRANVADVLERLEKRGLLTRAVNPRDRRETLMALLRRLVEENNRAGRAHLREPRRRGA